MLKAFCPKIGSDKGCIWPGVERFGWGSFFCSSTSIVWTHQSSMPTIPSNYQEETAQANGWASLLESDPTLTTVHVGFILHYPFSSAIPFSSGLCPHLPGTVTWIILIIHGEWSTNVEWCFIIYKPWQLHVQQMEVITYKMSLFNTWSLTNENFILNDFYKKKHLDIFFLTNTWAQCGESFIFCELLHRAALFSNSLRLQGWCLTGVSSTLDSNSLFLLFLLIQLLQLHLSTL